MNNLFNIIGIDPGNNLGISIYTINSLDYSIVNISTLIYKLDYYNISCNNYINKFIYLESIIENIIYNYNPLAIVMEDVFMHVRFPRAVIMLASYVNTIENIIVNSNSLIKLIKVMPKYMKSVISTGKANKEDIKIGLKGIPEIVKYVNVDLITEHEADAVGLGYLLYKTIQQDPLYLISM